tara:strand:+ start:179 stop:433 length:255 start_codon:yes stop_codon:yes gene_type:complete
VSDNNGKAKTALDFSAVNQCVAAVFQPGRNVPGRPGVCGQYLEPLAWRHGVQLKLCFEQWHGASQPGYIEGNICHKTTVLIPVL